jgi:hypothetical protein
MTENQNIPRRSTPPKTPGWVKVFFIVIALLIIVVVLAHLLGLRFDHGTGATFLYALQYAQLRI